MKHVQKLSFFLLLAMLAACKSPSDKVAAKKEELKDLKKQSHDMNVKIQKLEKQIAKLDPDFAAQMTQSVLISTKPVKQGTFTHKIEVSGEVASHKNVDLTAELSGKILSIKVQEGQMVKKGQLLMVLDAKTLQNQIQEVKTNLNLAKTVYEKQKKLWDQGYGTEIQYLQAKNRKESLERNLQTLQSRLDQAYIRAPFAGKVDDVIAREGQTAMPGVPLLRLVSLQDLYLTAEISEDYINSFHQGDSAEVRLPSVQMDLTSTIRSVGYVINQANRTFSIEVGLPKGIQGLQPNQLAEVYLVDYQNENVMMVPTNLIQKDNMGDYVFSVQEKDGQKIAHKIHVQRGKTYDLQTEILSGLKGNETLIDEGSRNVVEGVNVKVAEQNI